MFWAVIWSVAVFCGPTGDRAGWRDEHGVRLNNVGCETLRHPQFHPYYEIANTLYVLAHEQGHAHDPKMGLGDIPYEITCGNPGPCESYADCYAAGHVYALARTLGFTGYQARRYWSYLHKYRRLDGYEVVPQRCWQSRT